MNLHKVKENNGNNSMGINKIHSYYFVYLKDYWEFKAKGITMHCGFRHMEKENIWQWKYKSQARRNGYIQL